MLDKILYRIMVKSNNSDNHDEIEIKIKIKFN